MGDQFREAEAAFNELRARFHDRKISTQEFTDSLKKLRIKDDAGRFWVIGPRSGKWYAFENGEWIEAKPPSQMEKKAICIACGFENDLEAETCARCASSRGGCGRSSPPTARMWRCGWRRRCRTGSRASRTGSTASPCPAQLRCDS
jgi:hypothetical protein